MKTLVEKKSSGAYAACRSHFKDPQWIKSSLGNFQASEVTILLGNGSGGFSQAAFSPISMVNSPIYIVVGDFNDDGKQDLAVAHYNSNYLTILLGNGSGSFSRATDSPANVGAQPEFMVVGDFNGDGKQDLAVGGIILLGNGNGGFSSAGGSVRGNGSAVGDFNGDGKQDLADANGTILLNNCVPMITSSASLTRQQGSASIVSTIATVSDVETEAGSLTVSATVPSGLIVTGITNTNGTITANVAAACNATVGANTVVLRVFDGGNLRPTANLTVNVIANVDPSVTITGPASGAVYPISSAVNFTGSFDNAGNIHTANWTFNDINLDGMVNEATGEVSTSYTFIAAGVYLVTLTVSDGCGETGLANTINELTALVVVYDPNVGFVTGGGWINSPAGAYSADQSLSGKVSYGFVSKYQPGVNVPTGNTEFQFRVANFKFKSTSYNWLVVAGARAQFKGSGTINGSGDYDFMLTAIDGEINGGGGSDKLRIKIWDKGTGNIVYDNQMGAADGADLTTVIGGGSIVIHKQ